VQIFVAVLALLLFAAKIFAWYITHSVAILTDALESVANVVAGLIGVYSLYVAAKPRDHDHPYGHGKVEFISAAIEGAFIIVAGIMIIYKAAFNLLHPQPIHKLDIGIVLIAGTAVLNFLAGSVCVRIGKKNNSLALIASGRHLRSDMYTTAGIIAGLALLLITGITWIDSLVAIVFAIVILFTGYSILRSSIAGIMDEADMELLKELIATLSENRSPNWIC
jgi:cation diffusion facilitator family transporter